MIGWLKWKNLRPTVTDERVNALNEYRMYLAEKFKPSTVKRKLTAAKRFWGLGSSHPNLTQFRDHVSAQAVSVRAGGALWLSHGDEAIFVEAVKSSARPEDQAMILLLLYAGLRISELCDLEWRDPRDR